MSVPSMLRPISCRGCGTRKRSGLAPTILGAMVPLCGACSELAYCLCSDSVDMVTPREAGVLLKIADAVKVYSSNVDVVSEQITHQLREIVDRAPPINAKASALKRAKLIVDTYYAMSSHEIDIMHTPTDDVKTPMMDCLLDSPDDSSVVGLLPPLTTDLEW